MPVLAAQVLDQLRRVIERGRELLAEPLAGCCGQRVDLAYGRPSHPGE
jgi:hypothetical protein